VLLASGGLALLAVAAVAGAVYLLENRRLKRKRPAAVTGSSLPSLEALDRVAAVALAVGFPLLTLGVASGMLWLEAATGRLWTGSAHEAWNALAWALYALLVTARFAAGQGARNAAASAVAGFVFLLFAVVGVGILA
jgi:ABC-type transport system involved in cytochrome c biogenesis permease subunit